MEAEHRAELARLEHAANNLKHKQQIRAKIDNSDEKIQSLALLMLHYCAGLQHCLDGQEEDRQRKAEEDRKAIEDRHTRTKEEDHMEEIIGNSETDNETVAMENQDGLQNDGFIEFPRRCHRGSFREEEILRDEISGLTIKLTTEDSNDDEDDREEEERDMMDNGDKESSGEDRSKSSSQESEKVSEEETKPDGGLSSL